MKPTAVYDYVNEGGRLVARKERYANKEFYWKHLDESDNLVFGLNGEDLPPYNLKRILSSTVETIYFCEGERDADTLTHFDLCATTSGSSTSQNVVEKPSFKKHFANRELVLLPDADEPGRAFMQDVARILHEVATSIRLVPLPGLLNKGEDVTDFFETYHHTKQEFLREVWDEKYIIRFSTHKPEEKSKTRFYDRFTARPFTEEILCKYKFFCTGVTDRDSFLWYDERIGLWREDSLNLITNFFRRQTDSLDDLHKTIKFISEIVADIRGSVWKPDVSEFPEPPKVLMPLKSSVFNVDDGTVREFRPEDCFRWKLPWNADDHGDDELCRLMSSFGDSDLTEDLFDLISYSLWRDYSFQKVFFLLGPGSNGKSTFSNILVNLVGRGQVAALGLDEIQGDKFSTVNLRDKLINISGEIADTSLKSTSVLKKLSGSDSISANRKFQSRISFTNFAKLIFLANKLPRTYDDSPAFFRRAYLIRFDKTFPEDPKFLQRIDDPEAMKSSYEKLLFVALEHLRELRKRNFIFANTKSVEAMRREYQAASDPVSAFIEANCDREGAGMISKEEFGERFNSWARERDLIAFSPKRLTVDLKENGFPLSKRTIKKGSQEYVVLGLSWKR